MNYFIRLLNRYKHINWALADQSMVSGVNFLTGILFARFLGLEEYGRFTLAWMTVLFFNSFQQAGIIAPMMSIGPKQEKDHEAAYYGAVFIHQLVWSTGCAVLLWVVILLSGFIKPEWHIQNLAIPLAVTLFAWQLQDFIRRYFFVRSKSSLAFLNDAVSYLGQLLVLLLLFQLTTLNTAQVLWVIAVTSMLAVLTGLLKIRRIASPSGMLYAITRTHWHFSKWMLGSALMQWTSGNYFIIAAGSILGPSAAGALKASQNIMGVSHILFQGLENIVPARASHLFFHGGSKPLLSYLKKVTYWGGGCTLFIAATAGIFPDFWLKLLYGNEFQGVGYVLQWYAVIYLLVFLGFPLRSGLRAMDYSKPIFVSYILSTFFTLLASAFLVKQMGIIGATAGILITQIICQSSLLYSLWRIVSGQKE